MVRLYRTYPPVKAQSYGTHDSSHDRAARYSRDEHHILSHQQAASPSRFLYSKWTVTRIKTHVHPTSVQYQVSKMRMIRSTALTGVLPMWIKPEGEREREWAIGG